MLAKEIKTGDRVHVKIFHPRFQDCSWEGDATVVEDNLPGPTHKVMFDKKQDQLPQWYFGYKNSRNKHQTLRSHHIKYKFDENNNPIFNARQLAANEKAEAKKKAKFHKEVDIIVQANKLKEIANMFLGAGHIATAATMNGSTGIFLNANTVFWVEKHIGEILKQEISSTLRVEP